MAEINDFTQRMIELQKQLKHYQVTEQRAKAVEVSEEIAEMWLAGGSRMDAARCFQNAVIKCWSYGNSLLEDKEQDWKKEALEAYNRALSNYEKADYYDPSLVHALVTKAMIEKAIKDLQTY